MAMQLRKRARISYAPAEEEEDEEVVQSFEPEVESDQADSDSDVGETRGASKKRKLAKQKKQQEKKARKPKVAKVLKPNQIFRFLELPAELRNKIYALCLTQVDGKFELSVATSQHRYSIRQRGKDRWPTRKPDSRVNALLLNKSSHQEAASLLYAQEIHFANYTVAQTFMAGIGSQNRDRLRHLSIGHNGGWPGARDLFFTFNTLALAPNVKELHLRQHLFLRHIRHTHCTSRDGSRFANKLYREAIHWFETVAVSNNAPFAGLEILKIADEVFMNRWLWDLNKPVFDEHRQNQVGPGAKRKEAFENEIKKIMTSRFEHTLAN